MTDFYDLLQISPNAEVETIHRVYQFLAARYHPDNQKSGNPEVFRLLKTAHDVLSDPVRRAEYDATRKQSDAKPLSASVDFLDNLDGEFNRRMAVLVVLYYQRRSNPYTPELSLKEIEERMGFPRDYLEFTLWYLHKKNYITRADNAQFEMTVDGVDFVETERARLPVLQKLLASTSVVSAEMVAQSSMDEMPAKPWEGKYDRRVGAPDFRVIKTERRKPAHIGQ